MKFKPKKKIRKNILKDISHTKPPQKGQKWQTSM
jgi:hypothetical protein